MTKEIERLIRTSMLRDVQIELKRAQLDNIIIPEVVFEIIKKLEEIYGKYENLS